jgi:hypothetical protein
MRTSMPFAILLLVLLTLLPSDAAAQRRGAGGFGNALRNAAGAPALETAALLPSGVHAGYETLDAENPLGDEYSYLVTGIANYDEFFRGVARVRGTLALADYALQRVDLLSESGKIGDVSAALQLNDGNGVPIDLPATTRRGIVMRLLAGDLDGARSLAGNAGAEQLAAARDALLADPEIVTVSTILPAAYASLVALPADVEALVAVAPSLATDAPSAFAGPQALNAPRVTEELGRATATLGEIPGQIEDIALQLHGLTSID